MTDYQYHPQSTDRIGALDGLRGIAILSVIFLHWVVRPGRDAIEGAAPQIYELLNKSAHGVDVFFVISGFLIGRILLSRSTDDGFLKTFYVRRFLRIVPLYFAVICLFFIGRLLFGEYPENNIPIWSYFPFVNNIYGALGVPSIAEFEPYWSLAIEEQFYLSSALIAAFLGRRGVVLLATIFVLGSLMTRVAVTLSFIDIGVWQFTLGHTDPIGIGLLVAAALQNTRVSTVLRNHIGLVKLVGALSFLAFFVPIPVLANPSLGIDILLISIAVGSWILLKFLSQPRSLLSIKPLRRIGEMTFSLYILHQGWAVYAGAVTHSGNFGAVKLVISFALLLAVCRLLWVYVEAPLIAFGHNWRYGDRSFRTASSDAPVN